MTSHFTADSSVWCLGCLDHNHCCPADLPYFLGLGVLTVYIGAHRGLTSKSRQQLTVKEVSSTMRQLAASLTLSLTYFSLTAQFH